MRFIKSNIILITLLSAVIISSINISAQEPEYPAEINARVVGEIPSIKVSEWTSIDIMIKEMGRTRKDIVNNEINPALENIAYYVDNTAKLFDEI